MAITWGEAVRPGESKELDHQLSLLHVLADHLLVYK